MQCPYCERGLVGYNYKSHSKVCIKRPSVAERIREGFAKVCPDGVIMSRYAYEQHVSGRNGMPCARTLERQLGEWVDIAQWAGLRVGGEWDELVWAESRNLLQELAYRLHEGQFGPSRQEWDICRPSQLPTSSTLIKRFGRWSSVLAWGGGLTEATRGYYASCESSQWTFVNSVGVALDDVRERLRRVEAKIMAAARAPEGVPVSAPREGKIYDWRTRSWRQCSIASVR